MMTQFEDAYYKLLNDILAGYNRATPNKIFSLRNNQIFVFGTDTKGSQRSGAAGLAANSFEAQVGVVDGPTGRCYALPTKGFTIEDLAHAVARFEQYVRNHMNYTYLVTPVGCGHAGFQVSEVAELFRGFVGLNNVMLPELFLQEYRKECFAYLEQSTEPALQDDDEEKEDVYMYFDESLHDVVRYLLEHNIPFNMDGGFSICDNAGNIIAEAELGIESEKIVFAPFNSQSTMAFKNNGYAIYDPLDYLHLKSN